tara:strand:- start:1775 stop:2104 length:330 start_codon:yes stop_codon:yes gene_type:complete
MSPYELVQNDSRPQIKATLTQQDTGLVANFNGGSARLRFRKKGTTTVLFTLSAIDAGTFFSEGVAVFQFGATDLAIAAGLYEGEIEVTYSDGQTESVFEVLEFIVRDDF